MNEVILFAKSQAYQHKKKAIDFLNIRIYNFFNTKFPKYFVILLFRKYVVLDVTYRQTVYLPEEGKGGIRIYE